MFLSPWRNGHHSLLSAGDFHVTSSTLPAAKVRGEGNLKKDRKLRALVAKQFMIKNIKIAISLSICLLLPVSFNHAADLKLSGLFSDHLVLQRDKPVPVWGWATAESKLTVEFAGQKKTATANAAGEWLVTLDAMPASAKPSALTVQEDQQPRPLTIRNVLVGDVWLLAGGSELWKRTTEEQVVNSPVHLFNVSVGTAPTVNADVKGRWDVVTSSSFKRLPAEACFLGMSLGHRLGVPVGIVQTAMGKPIESWMSGSALKATPAAAPILAYYASDAWKIRTVGTYEERLAAWKEFNQTLPLNPSPKPRSDDLDKLPQDEPSAVWNAMVAPLTRYPFAGVVWNQGEDWQSQNRARQQGQLLEAMIPDWRTAFGNRSMPFIVIQLRPHRYAIPFGIDGRLAAELRDGQRTASTAAGATLAVTIDLSADPHPRDVATRVVDTLHSKTAGPEFGSAEIVGREVVLSFKNADEGLVAKGGKLRGFAIASSVLRWVWAEARIEGSTVIVSAPTIEKPQGVRYAWEDLPSRGANLFNITGQPAAPFRTDDHLSCTAHNIDPSYPVLRFSPRTDLGIEDPQLPRILIIGDSISGHYLPGVRARMRGLANVIGESSMTKGTWASMGPSFYRSDWAARGDNLKKFLTERGPFDIVHFNNGIHNFASAKPGDEKPYVEQLRIVVSTIRAAGAVCLFANSTGTVADNTIPKAPNYLTNCRAFNAAAEAVMRELNVPVTDIYGMIQPRIRELISSDLIHTNKEADEMMADLIARRLTEILPLLQKRKP
ncbi:MAG: hypothetical protein O2857_01115 [Planctomycetota bacterium]|nr:hypothetical protein [Planctomycetota bacterium]